MLLYLHVSDGLQALVALYSLLEVVHQGLDVLTDLAEVQVHVLE